jgi:DNA-binding transcriptional regulator YiaG
MTFDEFKAALKAIGMSQRGFARLIKADKSTITKWAAQPSVPGYAKVIIDLLLKERKSELTRKLCK